MIGISVSLVDGDIWYCVSDCTYNCAYSLPAVFVVDYEGAG